MGDACIAILASTKYQTVKEIAFDVLTLGNDDVFYTTASDLRKLDAVFNLEIVVAVESSRV